VVDTSIVTAVRPGSEAWWRYADIAGAICRAGIQMHITELRGAGQASQVISGYGDHRRAAA